MGGARCFDVGHGVADEGCGCCGDIERGQGCGQQVWVGFKECGVWVGAGGDVDDVGPGVVQVAVGVDGDGAVVADDGEWPAGGGPGADEVVCSGGGFGGGDGFEFVGGEGGVDVAGFGVAHVGGVGQDLEGIVVFLDLDGRVAVAAVGEDQAQLSDHGVGGQAGEDAADGAVEVE